MDWYSYYKEHFTRGTNPNVCVANCQRIVMELLNNHLIPFRIAADSCIGYLAALYDAAGDCFSVGFAFRIAMNALDGAMQRAYEVTERKDREWAQELLEAERADGYGPSYEPDDYTVEDIDLEGVEMDGVDDDPTLNELYLCDKESEGSHSSQCIDSPDSESEGLSKFFLDFEHIESWGRARWVAFMAHIDMAIDIASTDPAGVDSMARLLTEIRDNFDRIPMDSQKQARAAADRLALAIRDQTENIMDTLQDKHQIDLISECVDGNEWTSKNDLTEGFIVEPPNVDESAASLISEPQLYLDLSGWGNWSVEDWVIFDQAVADAQTAAIASPADPMPAIHLFLSIRQNIEALERHRRFSMGNTADDLLEAVKKGMAQDLFQIQQKCPYAPRPIPMGQDTNQLSSQHKAFPVSDGTSGRWKRGQVGRETVELNFDHLDNWNLSQWAAFKIQMDKMTAAAETTMDALGQPGQLLEDIRAHVHQIPQHYMEDVSQMVSRLVQAICGKTSETLAEILQGCGRGDAANRSSK